MTSNAQHQIGGGPPQYNYGYNQEVRGSVMGVQLSNLPVTHDQPSAVTVIDPKTIISDIPPDPERGFVLSALTVIFCFGGSCCGVVATLLAWKAKLQVFDSKFAHARHTMKTMWLFYGIALSFGILLWLAIIVPLAVIAAY